MCQHPGPGTGGIGSHAAGIISRATIALTQPEDRSPAQVTADQRWLARFRYCAGCDQMPCACTDEAVDLILEAETYGLYSGGFDDSPEAWGA